MRILILGAGAVGGYLGARLAEASADVTHLVRASHAARLRSEGLRVKSPLGNVSIYPRLKLVGEKLRPYDIIVLACKAYALTGALDAVEPAVGPGTRILPLVNGVGHLQLLDNRFRRETIMGGVAHLAVTRTGAGIVSHLNDFHRFFYGARHQDQEHHCSAIQEILSATILEHQWVSDVEQAMWDKFVFLTTLAGATCTLRGSIGEILATARGRDFVVDLFEECTEVAVLSGRPPPKDRLREYRSTLTAEGSTYAASMLRDIENGLPTEADHIVGDMLGRAARLGLSTPRLGLAYAHLQVYEHHLGTSSGRSG